MATLKKKAPRDRSNDDAMAETFASDPAYAVELLNSILEDGDPSELLVALRQMSSAFGGVSAVAERAELNPTQGNPALNTLAAILKTMGLRLAVQQIKKAA
jgi:DNA-binding phage protein